MPQSHVTTTQRDVVADLIAAIEMYDGTCGSDSTVIDEVIESVTERDTIVISLSNGDSYDLRVRG